PLCALFGLGADVAGEYGVFAVRCYLSGAVFAGLNIIFMDYYQAVNREKLAFIISFLRGFALLLPFAFLCGRLFHVRGIWLMFPLTELLTLGFTLLLATQMHKWLPSAEATVPTRMWLLDANVESILPVLSEAEEFVESLDATPRQSMRVVLMIEELCTAIIQVGFAKAQGCIQVTLLRLEDESFELHIRDNALSFNMFAAKTKRISSVDDVNEDTLNSLPLLLIQKNAKSHFYRRYQGFNTLSLIIGE
ncbi:MAG: ATP-binding protein, partial [Angelakisella sp.]